MVIMKKYKLIMQEEQMDCGIACLATICAYYNMQYSLTYIKSILNFNDKATNFFQLFNVSQILGFNVRGIFLKGCYLKEYITLPCIAQIKITDEVTHFVVIFEINNKNITIGNPSKNISTLSLANFTNCFTGNILLLFPK